MKRFIGASLFVSLAVLVAGACDDSSNGDGYGGGSACAAYTTCGTCTPVQGCGWCFNSTGGQCASDPDTCAGVSEFTWTWDSTGCPDVEAGVSSTDASASEDAGTNEAPEASAPEASPPPPPAPDAGVADSGSADALSEAAPPGD